MTSRVEPVRAPVRARVAAAFGAVMLVLLSAVSVLAYRAMGIALEDEIDSALRFRAVSVLQTLPSPQVLTPDRRLQEPTEAFVQVLSRDGTVRSATRGFASPLLDRSELARIDTPVFLSRAVPGVAGSARLLAVPVAGSRDIVIVGASTADRRDALHELAEVLLIGGPVAIALACLAAWLVAGWALRPIERLRVQASAITASGLDRRLSVPRTRDEVQRLALTLNDMLDRLAHSMAGERAFLEHAGHELRTPLAALRAEVDLALRRRRTPEELTAALQSVSQETDRLARLADDLLVLARAADGRLPVQRVPVPLDELLGSVARLFAAQAHAGRIELEVSAPARTVEADPVRLRQALTNLVANALRHTPHGGRVLLTGAWAEDEVRIAVTDNGPGFDPSELDGSGLGLRLVAAVVDSHGGHLRIGRGVDGGALVELTVPHGP